MPDQPEGRAAALARCVGCADDFYNGKNPLGVRACWHLKDARPVVRYRIGWWVPPTTADAFQRVVTNQCHNAYGQYELREESEVPKEFLDALREAPDA